MALIYKAASQEELLWQYSFENVHILTELSCTNRDALPDSNKPHCSPSYTDPPQVNTALHLRVYEVISETSVLARQELMDQLQAHVYYCSIPIPHPSHPFSSLTGQANLIWHPSIQDLSSIVTLSSTNIENHTWNLCNPDVHANKVEMKWQAGGRGGAVVWGGCACVEESCCPIFFLHGICSQVGFYVLIFSLKNSNWIMKYSFK
jgi:hypothetical protein